MHSRLHSKLLYNEVLSQWCEDASYDLSALCGFQINSSNFTPRLKITKNYMRKCWVVYKQVQERIGPSGEILPGKQISTLQQPDVHTWKYINKFKIV